MIIAREKERDPIKQHVHKYELGYKRTLLHSYDVTRKERGSATASDTLKFWVCGCGHRVTVDLRRKLL